VGGRAIGTAASAISRDYGRETEHENHNLKRGSGDLLRTSPAVFEIKSENSSAAIFWMGVLPHILAATRPKGTSSSVPAEILGDVSLFGGETRLGVCETTATHNSDCFAFAAIVTPGTLRHI